jgi:hypothetical protein
MYQHGQTNAPDKTEPCGRHIRRHHLCCVLRPGVCSRTKQPPLLLDLHQVLWADLLFAFHLQSTSLAHPMPGSFACGSHEKQ